MNLSAPLSRLPVAAAVFAAVALSSTLHAQDRKKNPTSKFFVADLNGNAQVDTGAEVDDLSKKSVYNAEGTVIETKPKSNYAMVYSNGTGAYFDTDTKVDIRQFEQEPFRPNRTDADVEPSISQTHAFVERGTVGLCTSKLVAGSTMSYQTPHGSVNIRGRKIVIDVSDKQTVISMVEGDSTVQGGEMDTGGHILHDGEQAIITPGAGGQPATVKIQPIPTDQRPGIEDRVTAACVARKTVYFETVGQKGGGGDSGAGSTVGAPDTSGTGGASGDGSGSAFLGAAANGGGTTGSSNTSNNNTQTIVAVPVVNTDQTTVVPQSDGTLTGG